MMVITSALGIGVLLIALLDMAFITELASGLASIIANAPMEFSINDFNFVVLIPAHNEAATITRAAPYLRSLVSPRRRVLLVADNCTDQTAIIAHAIGLEVIERSDAEARGKGYALAFGRDALQGDPPAVVVVLDADCELSVAGLDRLAAHALADQRPIQGSYLFRPALTASPAVQISNFAFLVKNLFRQRGLARIGASSILTGSGMAFPWPIFNRLNLATGNVVEDLELTADLAEMQIVVGFEEAAKIWSDCTSVSGTIVQRTRWEAGFLSTGFRRAPRLLAAGCRALRFPTFWLGVHLMIPPLALLLVANFLLIVVLQWVHWVSGSNVLSIMATALELLLLLIALTLTLAWRREGRHHVTLVALARIPAYILWKIPVYFLALFNIRRLAWVRTERVSSSGEDQSAVVPPPDADD